MKKAMQIIFMVILASALVFGSPMPALADVPPEDIVMNEAELQQWCDDHASGGGTVYLGSNITISDGVESYGQGHIVIDTQEYGLIYDGATISLPEYEITGIGVDVPVVTVVNAGTSWWMGNWNNVLVDVAITARGNGMGQGGTALLIESGDEIGFSLGMVYLQSPICAYGDNAIGIQLMEPLDMYCMNVVVSGSNSTAIAAPDGTRLFYCKLKAQGQNAKAVSDNDIVLDNCTADPPPPGLISRWIDDISGKRFYLPVRYGDMVWPEWSYTFWLKGDDSSIIKETFVVEWDQNTLGVIDTTIVGETIVPGKLLPIFDGLGLDKNFPLKLVVEVRDPNVPTIGSVYLVDFMAYANFTFFDEYDPASSDFKLLRSDDMGETWYDFTNSGQLEWPDGLAGSVGFYYDSSEFPVMFKLSVNNVDSNFVTIYEKDGQPYGDTGGDRTGTDRDGGGNNDDNTGGENNNGANGGGNNDNSDNTGGNNNSGRTDGNGGGANTRGGSKTTGENNSVVSPSDAPEQGPAIVAESEVIATSGSTKNVENDDTLAPAPLNIPVYFIIFVGLAALGCIVTLIFLRLKKASK